MDLQAIEDAIYELEQSSTTQNNVYQLASLYIVRQNLENGNLTQLSGSIGHDKEALPTYKNYCELKRNFELGQGSEEAALSSLSYLCNEIESLFNSLYSNSSSRKERKILKESIQKIQNIL